MMTLPPNKIAFRRILPIMHLVVFFTLTWLVKEHQRAFYAEWDAAEQAKTENLRQILARRAEADGGPVVGWDLRAMWDGDASPAMEFLLCVNLPATLVALPPLLVIHSLTSSKWASDSIFALAVVGFWYLIGRGMDGSRQHARTVYLAGKAVPKSRRFFALLLAVLGIALAIVLLALKSHSRPLIAAVAFWCAFAAAWQAAKLWEFRALSRELGPMSTGARTVR